MAGYSIQMHIDAAPDFSKVFAALDRVARFEDMEEVARVEKELGEVSVRMVTYEKYYARVSSYASLSILFLCEAACCTAHITASGGGDGAFNFSYGANRSFANICADAMQELGFRRDDSEQEDKKESFFSRLLN